MKSTILLIAIIVLFIQSCGQNDAKKQSSFVTNNQTETEEGALFASVLRPGEKLYR